MRNNIKTILFTVTFSLCACFLVQPQYLQSASIHAILVGDTLDEDLGYDFELNLSYMKKFIHEVSQHTGLKPVITQFKDEQTTTYQVLDFLNNLEVEENDVLVLYFCMHGYRTPSKKNQWPNLHFGEDEMGIDFNYLAQFGKEKMPRLLISIADSCNSEIPDGAIKTITQHAKMAAAKNQNISENYKRLFLHSKGSIIISGSVPGEYSWYLVGKGGSYTLNFLENFRNVAKNSSRATWDQILSKTSQAVQKQTAAFTEGGQHPQYELLLKN